MENIDFEALLKLKQDEFLQQLLAPAYAEVDCPSGAYTGWRMPFEGDPIQPRVPLYPGRYQVTKKTPGAKSCLYA